MKKIFPVLVLSSLLLILSACGSSPSSAPAPSPSPAARTVTAVSTPAPTPRPTPAPEPVYEDGMKADGKIHVYLNAAECEHVNTPDSSFINYIEYFPSSKHLIICMNSNSKEYVFANVSSSVWSGLKTADSVGSYYTNNIRDKTSYWVTDYNGKNGDLIVIEYID